MPLPETIAMRFTEEDAGYVTVRPVVKQTFRLAELTDMVVSVTGKNASRVQQIFRAGTVVYNGYRYWWNGFASDHRIAAHDANREDLRVRSAVRQRCGEGIAAELET